MKYCVAILAGGKSSRMGKDKALLELNGRRFLDQLAEEFKCFGEVFVSVDDKLKYESKKYRLVPDLYKDCGPMGGIYSVFCACDAEALIVIPCDVPLISASMVKKMECQMEKGADIIITETNDGKIHPLCGIYKRSLLPKLKECLEKKTYKMRILLSCGAVQYYKAGEESWRLTNINTPKDYNDFLLYQCSKSNLSDVAYKN